MWGSWIPHAALGTHTLGGEGDSLWEAFNNLTLQLSEPSCIYPSERKTDLPTNT